MTQHHYREELVVAIFLGGLDNLISSQIWGSMLSETRLLTLTITFSSALGVSNGTPLLSSPIPPPLHHLTLWHCYLPIPREIVTTQMVAEGSIEGMVASHSLHVSSLDGLIIVLIVVGRSLANLIGFPILPLLMILPLHPWVWWLYLGRTMIVLWRSSSSLVASCIDFWLLDHWLKGIYPYVRYTILTYSLIQIITTFICFYCGWSCLSYCGTRQGQSDLLTPVISSPLCSQFPCQPLIYQLNHQSIILLHLILSLQVNFSGFADWEED